MFITPAELPDSFADFALHPSLLQALVELGYTTPTSAQAQALPPLLSGHDMLLSAATGSGKSAALLVPAVQRLLQDVNAKQQVLLLAPTRELAEQLTALATDLTAWTDLHTVLITGGADFKRQQRQLTRNALLIATPGRLVDQLAVNPNALKNVALLLIDEADRMLDLGFSGAVLQIAEHCTQRSQTVLCSATLNQPTVLRLAENLLTEPVKVLLSNASRPPFTIKQQVIPCDDLAHKQQVLAWLLKHETYTKALVFANSKLRAESLSGPLRAQQLRVGVLHGDLTPEERQHVMSLLRTGTISILLSTDVAGRGLDIKDVDLVINFEMPRSGQIYVHRIGRTGRMGDSGTAIALVSAPEWNLMYSIERYLQQNFERRVIQALAGKFNGPKKLKASGKAVGSKNKAPAVKKTVAPKPKQRHRITKNMGKRRVPSGQSPKDTASETD